MKTYKVDPVYIYLAPALSLKMTKVQLIDIDTLLIVEKVIRG